MPNIKDVINRLPPERQQHIEDRKQQLIKEEYYARWTKALNDAGYKTLIPTSEFLSGDLTEAYTMIQFWIDNGVILLKD